MLYAYWLSDKKDNSNIEYRKKRKQCRIQIKKITLILNTDNVLQKKDYKINRLSEKKKTI